MDLLREFVYMNEMADVEQEIVLIEGLFDRLFQKNSMHDDMLSSTYPKTAPKPKSVTDLPRTNDVNAKFEEAGKRLEAAKRGLSLANKLKTPEERKQHKSRIMANLNKLRALVKDIERTLASAPAPKGWDSAAGGPMIAAAESVEDTDAPITEFVDANTDNDLGTSKNLAYVKSLEARAMTMKKMLADNPADSRLSALLRKLVMKIRSLKEGVEPVVEAKVVSGYVVGSKKSDSVHSKKFDDEEACKKEAEKMNKDQNVDHYHCKAVYDLTKSS